MEWERGKEEALMEDFGCRHKEQWRSRKIVVNYHRANAAFEQLENKEVVAEAEKDEEDAENEEEEEEIIAEEELVIKYQSPMHFGSYDINDGRLSNTILRMTLRDHGASEMSAEVPCGRVMFAEMIAALPIFDAVMQNPRYLGKVQES
ncbi:hypothetical protein TEA_006956 [Camellia sinensis var. sinensis]|uniref:Uncharacterized protein n=1 Tax=Camellia sinensis var. sinensis TaxID=542762 RepID=A0A4S4DL10_CAMSN|nr:hypothetical protein TEA_006956 [Camellia sinensis var. sinensis]